MNLIPRIGQSDLSVPDLEELLNNIFSPILKQEIMISGTGFLAVAAREAAAAEAKAMIATAAAEKAKLEAKEAKRESRQVRTLIVMRGWHNGVSTDILINMVDLPSQKIKELVAAFEKVKTYYLSKKQTDMKELKKLSGLPDADIKALWALLQQQN